MARNRAGERTHLADTMPSSLINNKVICKDALGHPQAMLKTLSHLIWLRVTYGVELNTFDDDTGYTIDLKSIAGKVAAEDPYAGVSETASKLR